MSVVIKVLSDAYGMTTVDEELLSQFSEEILQKSFTRLQEAKEKRDIPSPVKYFISIATNLSKEAQRFPKREGSGGFKQVGSFVKVPAYVPDKRFNLTDAERISQLTSEISNLEDIIANPQNHFIKKVNLTEAIPNFENVLKHLKEELDELVNPKVEQTKEIDENDMTPEQWLIWNRKRKIQRLKEKHG